MFSQNHPLLRSTGAEDVAPLFELKFVLAMDNMWRRNKSGKTPTIIQLLPL
uniref:Uncharacterized protein n=1 Tax=Arundo donax TaxID=35708 RepID=A0A0A9CCL5_ARUDO